MTEAFANWARNLDSDPSRGKTTRLSTTEHPLIEKAHYDPDVEIRANVLLVNAREILQQIRN